MSPVSTSVFLRLPRRIAPAAIAAAALLAQACVSFPNAPPATVTPVLEDGVVKSIDGEKLPLMVWRAEAPRAVILAIHGMNDYGRTFELPGKWWAENSGFTTYALDQRGFGRSPTLGRWAGEETMIADLRAALSAVHAEHPGLPVYVVGHSMGAAVIMTAQADEPLDADGLILAAPGVWGGGSMPFFYRLPLNIAATFAPGKKLSGERVERRATDNIPMLQQMHDDPFVLKETRLDAIVGVVRIMGAAYKNAGKVNGDILVLIGQKDEVIPIKAMTKTAAKLCGDITVHRYLQGWHFLFRDLQREAVWRDVARWIAAKEENRNAADSIGKDEPTAFQCASAEMQSAR